jgi:hypothetical protein
MIYGINHCVWYGQLCIMQYILNIACSKGMKKLEQKIQTQINALVWYIL